MRAASAAGRPQKLAWLLGHERRQRLGIQRPLVAAAMYASVIAGQWYGVSLGLSAVGPARALSLCDATGNAALYVALRSGWTMRRADPALAFPQMVFATLCLAWGYTNNATTRGGLLMVLALVITFGAYAMPARDIQRATIFAIGALGAAMAWKSTSDPEHYPAGVERLHFFVGSTVLCAFAFIAGQVSSLRAHAAKQRKELRAALERIAELCTHDELTGLYNRRHLQLLLDTRRETTDVWAVAMLDLDHFKTVNDRFGHAAGDETLRVAADVLRTQVCGTDVVGRWGGEECLVLLPGANSRDAVAAIARVRERLVEAPVPGVALTIRFSAGVAIHARGDSIEATLERADRALYAAKERGRNCTVLSLPMAEANEATAVG